jgi:hypothetical protein
MTAPRLPFDRIMVQSENGARELSLQEFLRIPLAERIRHILRRNLQFFRGDAVVDSKVAVGALRESWIVPADDAEGR